MKITFKGTFKDSWRFNIYHQFRSWSYQIPHSVIPILIIIFVIVTADDSAWVTRIGGGIILGLVLYLLMWVVNWSVVGLILYSSRDKSIPIEHIVELQDDAIYEETCYERSYYSWQGIERIVRCGDFTAVYISANKAVIIPDRAFQSKAERYSFLAEVIKRKENARQP